MDQEEHGEKPVIYASFYPIYSLVSSVAGDTAEVRSFLPDSQDPHLWEPTPKDIKELSEADLLVINGANMEPWVPQVQDILPDLQILRLSDYVDLINYKGAAALGEFQFMGKSHFEKGKEYSIIFGHTHEKSMRGAFFRAPADISKGKLIARGREVMNEEGVTVEQHANTLVEEGKVYNIQMGHESGDTSFTFPSSDNWIFVSDRESEDLLSYSFVDDKGNQVDMPAEVEGGSSKTDTSSFDPHSWLSVVNAKRYANAINATLAELMPGQKNVLKKNKAALVKELTTIQAQFKEKLKQAPRRQFVTAHNAFAYLARDYQITQFPLQGLTTNTAPTLRVLIEAIRFAKQQDISVIYYEYGTDPKTAKVVADEIGGSVLPLNSMEYGSGSFGGRDHGYAEYMEMNLENLYESLK